ncbi:MAG TPA: hypothetical protein VFB22_02660 [Candidatus Baltobacteraceae bacterium]|nr:hypothetical protein [Candidatus Baltobacteraceae bacterium]
MPGLGRTAALTAAFLLCSAVWATAEAPQAQDHVLPSGTALVFVSDGHLDAGARAGSSVGVHLRDPLTLDGLVVAPAGAKARLVVGDVDPRTGKPAKVLVLEQFRTNPGLLPVSLDAPQARALDAGTTIDGKTSATVMRVGDRLSIETPFPFRLGNDMPASAYTPTPARTANPKPARGRPDQTPTTLPRATPFEPRSTPEPGGIPGGPQPPTGPQTPPPSR